ncbi:glycosyltransferase family 39 protein [Marinomonas ostreistagni]|uniref:ArnT family glycosyltransferase n=1 Tax=Marinomonas ostreistagni TaxID=359209 RepID=UPI002D7FC91D|nr:glycosyltransferase family 39 protein [Marinomonas ostreistagni]
MIKYRENHLWMILAFALLLRLISLATYPLMDTTEARYGEMARLMVETGNWLTPQFDYGVPFWGKPPLFTWMSALGIKTFGLSEFAVRAPHWLAGVVTILLMAWMSKRLGFNPLVTALVLATCGIFSISAGAVMTDMALTLSLTMAMMGFYFAWLGGEKQRLWGYLGFLGLACGLLAKGPLVLVLMGLTVMPWLMLQHGFVGAFKVLWQRFPIVTGILLMLMVALPWYLMAERATPGFLDYFLVGEHFKRFVVSGWQGDLYGSAHDEPRGMIWWFWLQAAFPWSFVLPILLVLRRLKLTQWMKEENGLFSFLMLWLLSPMILFTMAGNILPAYVLPGIPALGLLLAMLFEKRDVNWFSGISMVLPLLLMIMMLVLNLGKADTRSDRIIFSKVKDGAPTFYLNERPFSGQFYSHGQAKLINDASAIEGLNHFHLIGKEQALHDFVSQNQLTCSDDFSSPSGRQLYDCQQRLPKNISDLALIFP